MVFTYAQMLQLTRRGKPAPVVVGWHRCRPEGAGTMASSELAGLSQVQEDLDGFSDQAFRSLDILARALHVKNAELEPALQPIVSAAVTTLSSAQHAGLITVPRGALVPQATTGRPPHLLDQLQQKLNGGPCIDAAEQQALIRIPDMQRESRWPDFAAEAAGLGVCSM